MTPMQTGNSIPPASDANNVGCPHTHVRIVSRDEDSEYVECLACREIFEASEFKDMAIEENLREDEE